MNQIEIKKCKTCKSDFKPFTTINTLCLECAIKKAKKDNERKRISSQRQLKRKQKETKKRIKQELMTQRDWLKKCQYYFNRYTRLRDRNKPCISCGTTEQVRFDAGHYYSVGAYPNLRFNEDNCHKQCSMNCNKSRHGNIAEYTIRLPKRIGQERFDKLQAIRNQARHYTIPEIKELIKHYKQLIKELT